MTIGFRKNKMGAVKAVCALVLIVNVQLYKCKPIFGTRMWCSFFCDDDDDYSVSTSIEDLLDALFDPCTDCPRRVTSTALPPTPLNIMLPPNPNGMNLTLTPNGPQWNMNFVPWGQWGPWGMMATSLPPQGVAPAAVTTGAPPAATTAGSSSAATSSTAAGSSTATTAAG